MLYELIALIIFIIFSQNPEGSMLLSDFQREVPYVTFNVDLTSY